MPDRTNIYSHVQIIENTPSSVVVHWRYLPNFLAGNPHGNVKPDNFVDEVFRITPNGQVARTIKKATEKIDDWLDPLNQTTEVLQLGLDGVVEKSLTEPKHSSVSLPGRASATNDLENASNGPKPSLWFKLNEGSGETTQETETGAEVPILGPKALWKKGISGSALEFDGYHTVVSLPAAKAPALSSGNLTLTAWFALGAYPWNWSPVVQQGDGTGYFLGVDGHGYPGFRVKVHGAWEQLSVPNSPPYKDANHLNLFRWYHMAGTYNQQDGKMLLYVNGRMVAEKSNGKDGVQTCNADVRIGMAGVRSSPVDGGGPSEFGIDGLIDEVKIYDAALGGDQIASLVQDVGASKTKAPDMQKRSLPNPETGGGFKAVYTHLNYYETWDNLWRVGTDSDVVVGFDRLPTRFVFWRGVSYIPMLVNESNQWFTHEFNETGLNTVAVGDCEPMSDKACNDSHVRIIENNGARVVVEWRYRLANPELGWAYYDNKTGWGDIADWYYTIYPDGVASKLMRCYSSQPNFWHEWDEQIVVLGEGQHPEEVVQKTPVMTLVDEAGTATDYDWNPKPPSPKYTGQIIQKIHFKGKYSPFAIQKFDGGDVYGGSNTFYSVFPAWNHWPTSQINSSCRNASFPDRAAHSSVSHLYLPLYAKQSGQIPYQEKVLMEGMTDQPAASLVSLAKSWLHAPPLEAISDCRSLGYDQAQRAYVLCVTGAAPSFRIAASAQHPIANVCFVVKNWNCKEAAQLQIDSKAESSGPAFRQGIERDPNGRPYLVIWLQRQGTDPVAFTLRGAKPELAANNPRPTTWATVPQPVMNSLDVTMAATALPGSGNEYWFERVGGGGDSAVWQSAPVYTDLDLPANTEVVYRVKARDAYFAETEWSPAAKVKTAAALAPVIWSLDEGGGKTIKDTAGHHEGTIQGEASWAPGVAGKALHLDGKSCVQLSPAGDLHSNRSFTWMAWIRTTQGGTILARSGPGKEWARGGKAMFVQNGRLRFDAGWVGQTGAEAPVADGKWHHVAVVANRGNIQCFVDGSLSGSGRLDVATNEEGFPIRMGFCNDNFPKPQSCFIGDLDEVQWFRYALSPEAVSQIYRTRNGDVK